MFDGPFLALDIASRCGVAEGLPGERPRLFSVDFKKSADDEMEDICSRGVLWIAERLKVDHPALVIVEAPIPAAAMNGNTNANTTALAFGLLGAIAGCIRCKGIPVRRANIQRVRKHFIGRGNLPGDEAKRRVAQQCRALGWDAPNHDAADAAAVWSWACSQFAPAKAQRVEPLFIQKRAVA